MKSKLSILIPTRNRIGLLKKLLNYILKFDDFKIVVCDNFSTDGTFKYFKKLVKQNKNIKYYRSTRWIQKEKFVLDWCFQKVETEFFLYLFDDDFLLVNYLITFIKSKNFKEINQSKFISFNRGLVLSDIKKKSYSLKIPKFDSKVYTYSSKSHLKNIFNNNKIFLNTPMVTNTIFRKSFLSNLKKKYNTLSHFGHMGDYTLSCMMLTNSKNFAYINFPLVIYREWKENTSVQIHQQKTTMSEYLIWINNFKKKYSHQMPLNIFLWSNCVYVALNNIAKILKINLSVSKNGYLKTINDEIASLENLNKKKYHFSKKELKKYLKENQLFIKNLETKESYLKLKESNLEKYSLYGRVKLSQNEKNIFYKNLDNKKFSLGLNRLKLFLQNKKTKLKKLLK